MVVSSSQDQVIQSSVVSKAECHERLPCRISARYGRTGRYAGVRHPPALAVRFPTFDTHSRDES